ncbi:dipeptidase PepE [uncultured Dokdonia sp.]|uniref:dipeptidase PepE n=1 Tax=Dokdonia sp. Asnod2-E02 TaxID=3160574 RepID=UPI002616613A|nr:dipeptidase PepE [uncultured Dokdonia sp.]
MSKNIIAASTSTIYGDTYLEYLLPELKKLFHNVTEIIFIPYARPGGITHDDYTTIAQKAFAKINISVKGLHTYKDATEALKVAQGIFTGGGNTFVLVNQLYKIDVMHTLRDVILNGTPYLGTSAGSNLCGLTMQTTNDMPIAYPPSFKTLGVLPFNVNPHYLDPDTDSTHMGETRETRIKEYHIYNTVPVLGIREGSWIRVKGKQITLQGDHTARVFKQDKEPYEIESLSTIKL